MTNAQFGGFTSWGMGDVQTDLSSGLALSTSRAIVEVRLPAHCVIKDVEAAVSSIASATLAKLSVWRDSGADTDVLVGEDSQTITTGTTTATNGGCRWTLDKDVHPNGRGAGATQDSDYATNQYITLYFAVALNAGTATLDALTVNYRAGL